MSGTVLIVDDDATVRVALEEGLRMQEEIVANNLVVETASGGEAALECMARTAGTPAFPQVVVTDLIMPACDGFKLSRQIRALYPTQAVELILISGIFREPQKLTRLCKELQAAFMLKPIDMKALAKRCVEAVGMKSTREEADNIPHQDPALPLETDPTGPIAKSRVPALLLAHLRNRTTGTLHLHRGQTRKSIYLREGHPIAADSNLRQEALGSLLLAKRVIDDKALKLLLQETQNRGQKMGAVLVQLGWMSPDDVLSFLALQARIRIIDCLRWREGFWRLTPGDDFSDRVIEHDLAFEERLFAGLKRTSTPHQLGRRVDQDGNRRWSWAPTPRSTRAPLTGPLDRAPSHP